MKKRIVGIVLIAIVALLSLYHLIDGSFAKLQPDTHGAYIIVAAIGIVLVVMSFKKKNQNNQ